MKLAQVSGVVPIGMLLSLSVAAHGPLAANETAPVARPTFEPTMVRVVPYPDEEHAVPYACYRVGRCSLHDLHHFAGRPNWLTRLAPEAPLEGDALAPSIEYQWLFVPVTPLENILPKYRTTSQVRIEYHAVGRPIDDPD